MTGPNLSSSLNESKIDPHHRFYTPSALARSLVERIGFEGAQVVLDPCSGQGAFYRAFPADLERLECEIDLDKGDFYDFDRKVSWIISNPPFEDLTKWIEHTCRLAQLGFAYLLPTYAVSASRLRIIESWGFRCSQMTLIDNPKEWNLGFPMAFYIFSKNGPRTIRLNGKMEPTQSTLELWTGNEGGGV